MKFLLKFFLIAIISSTVSAQLNTEYFNKLQTEKVISSDNLVWKPFGPGMAGYCEEFWIHPTDDNVMFQSPDMYNSYGTWDNGKSWQTIKDNDGTGKDMRRIQSIIFSQQDENFGYAIDVRGELYQTTDKGHTWNFQKDMGGKHAELTVDPSNDNNWYIGAGDFWNVKANHRKYNDLLGYVYTYADYGHIYKSTDKGKTWQKKKTGLPSTLDVGRIIVDPRNSNNIIIATNSGVYRSTDQGENWSLSGNGLPNNLPRDMTSYFDKTTNEFILYVVEQTFYEKNGTSTKAKGGIYKSTDGGINWTSITGNLAVDIATLNDYSTTSKYWRAISYWFDITQDEAKAQYPSLPTETFSVFNRLVVNPKNKNEIYITHNVKHDYAFTPGDVWKTTDGGTNWIATARTGTYWINDKNSSYWTSRNNPKGMNTKFAHLQKEKTEGDEYFGNRFLEINSKGEVFICLDQQVMRSNDNGANWLQIDDDETEEGSANWVGRGASNLPGRFMLLDTGIKDRAFFCSGEHGLWQSAPLGNYEDKNAMAVTQIEGQNSSSGAHSIASVAVNPKDPNTIYIIMFRQEHRGEFRRSTDGGKTWANVSTAVPAGGNLSSDNIFQYSLTVDFDTPSNIYFTVIENRISEVSGSSGPDGFTNFGVYKSTDSGNTWNLANNGFPTSASVRRIAMDPNNSTTLYAALNESSSGVAGGLYKTTNKGTNWTKMTIPSEIKAVNNVFIDKTTKNIFISCGRYEGTMAEGGVWKSTDEGATWQKIFEMPYAWQTETSPVNSNIITVVTALPHENKGATTFNPGAYISRDGGTNWIKVNKNLGQPDEITDFKPDPYTQDVYWCALKGSGWYKGVYNDGSNNFTLSTTGASCPNSSNGEILINALENDSYVANLKNTTFNKTENFNKQLNFNNLPSGNYNLTVSSTTTNVKQEFVINIPEPATLKVDAKVNANSKSVTYKLTGGETYYIKTNSSEFSTTKSAIEIPLNAGENFIEISTDKLCQGLFTDEISQNNMTVYPNPSSSTINISTGTNSNSLVNITIISSLGTVVYSKDFNNPDKTINLDINTLNTGIYIIKVTTDNSTKQQKFIKN